MEICWYKKSDLSCITFLGWKVIKTCQVRSILKCWPIRWRDERLHNDNNSKYWHWEFCYSQRKLSIWFQKWIRTSWWKWEPWGRTRKKSFIRKMIYKGKFVHFSLFYSLFLLVVQQKFLNSNCCYLISEITTKIPPFFHWSHFSISPFPNQKQWNLKNQS